MKIACVGAGYIGGSSMTIFAQKCPSFSFYVYDHDPEKIEAWNSNELPIYEPGLYDIIKDIRGKNLFFTSNAQEAIQGADIIFIAIGTPTKNFGTGAGKAAMLGSFETATRTISHYLKNNVIIVERSTVPVGVARSIHTILRAVSTENIQQQDYQIISNPEFLSEGNAIQDLTNPQRILIGHQSDEAGLAAAQKVAGIYRHWVPEEKIILSNVWSSELAKLAANAFLAQRVSSINSIAAICEKTGADVTQISRAVGADSRLGPYFLNASVGFGGPHFQKDILNLVYIAETLGLWEVAEYFNHIISMNNFTRNRFARNIVHTLFDTLNGKKIVCFGFAFKANTTDVRESSSTHIINYLLTEHANIVCCDPKVSEKVMKWELKSDNNLTTDQVLEKQFKGCNRDYAEQCDGAHALVILTDWDEFKQLDYKLIYSKMAKPAFLFDGRNLLNRDTMRAYGFTTHAIGSKPDLLNSK